MGIMYIPPSTITGRCGNAVTSFKNGSAYTISYFGQKTHEVVGELLGCLYVGSDDDTHYFSYVSNTSWGGLTMIVMVKKAAIENAEVGVFEVIEK